MREIIAANPTTGTVIFKLKNDPVFTGYVINMVIEEDGVVELDYTMRWTTKDGAPEKEGPDFSVAIKGAVLQAKQMAERTWGLISALGSKQTFVWFGRLSAMQTKRSFATAFLRQKQTKVTPFIPV